LPLPNLKKKNNMKIVAISDTHGMYQSVEVPDADMLIHAGDITSHGTYEDLENFNEWLGELPHKHKIVIAGNHDWCFEWDSTKSRQILTNAIYLQDEMVEIEGLRIYGSPWQPAFYDWAFNLPRGKELAEVWARIPDNLDILVTHGPPYGILDQTKRDLRNVGCQDLLDAVLERRPRFHIFGHIHEGYGQHEELGIHFINASCNTYRYRPTQAPIVFET